MAKKMGRKILIFVGVMTSLQVLFLSHYNHLLHVATSPISQGTKNTVGAAEVPTTELNTQLKQLSGRYQPLAVSHNTQFVAYMTSSNQLIVKNLSNQSVVATVQLKAPVVYLGWIRNDSVFVGEKFSVGNDNRLTLATIDVGTQSVRIVHTYSWLGADVIFKKITYSPYTNDVYVLIGNSTSTTLYHYDTMGSSEILSLGGRYVENVAVGQLKDLLYFQDYASGTRNVLVYQNGTTSLVHLNSVIIGVVGNNMYYGTLNSAGLVTAVYKYVNGSSVTVASYNSPIDVSTIAVSDTGKVTVGTTFHSDATANLNGGVGQSTSSQGMSVPSTSALTTNGQSTTGNITGQ